VSQITSLEKFFKGKNVLITGGTGTVGTALIRELLKYKPEKIRIYSRDETKQFELQNELSEYHETMRYFIGDVRDKERLKLALESTDIIFHAAALKHVPACEYNPFEALKTNVMGTQNVIEAARATPSVQKVIFISTDKATNPSNTMGVSKLFAERLVANANQYKGASRNIIFSSVRFGNVIGSRGSLIPLIKRQVETHDYVTLTDPTMTRFILSLAQATNLVLESAMLARGGETFILKMPVVNIKDFIEVLVEHYAPMFKKSPEKIEMKVVGIRRGEKLYEDLMTGEESYSAVENKDMFILLSDLLCDSEHKKYYDASLIKKHGRHASTDFECMSKKQILKMLQDQNVLL